MIDAAPDLSPGYDIREDSPRGVIRMTVWGFYDVPTLLRHFADNRAVVSNWRLSGRPIRVLIDAVALMPHSPEGQTIVQQSTSTIYREGDRVAVCVASSLVKMQMKRALTQGDLIDFFISERAALIWLDPDGEYGD